MTVLSIFVLLMFVLVFVGYINEKSLNLPTEIMLLISSLAIGLCYIVVSHITNSERVLTGFPIEYLSDFLVKGVLCFMLFSGACGLTFHKLKKHIQAISLLAIITTTISTFIYGIISFLMLSLLGFNEFSFMQCLLLGSIVAPTDPIAATGILKKIGLSEDLIIIIEGESLFNDGVGIALFVAISSAITSNSTSLKALPFLFVLFKEIVGAILIGLFISCALFYFFKRTKDEKRQIFISILALTMSYVVCQYLDFSSAIAAVVCGIYFATFTEKETNIKVKETKINREKLDCYRLYYDFWEVVDELLNHILYIILGIFFVNVFLYVDHNLKAIAVAIISVIVARFIGVYIVSFGIKKLPENFSRGVFASLLTWSGLKGGLSLALMIEAGDLLTTSVFNTMLISVFGIVIFTTVGQGLTVAKFYKKFK